ncbi:MAG TPA: FecR family protein [Bryobacteraceae bacterium]
MLCSAAKAQVVLARASSVSGRVLLTNGNGASTLTPAPGYVLGPGDRLDTRGGGQIVIELTDGSMIVVQPESVIVIKDFHSAASLRELFEIMLGSVRVKINHFYGRPNPYRINSPTASIAVRGTDFSVTVDSRGDTQVMVYEGSVEVTSLIDPTQSVVIEAGRGVLLAPGQGFQLFNVLPGRELAGNQGTGHGGGTSNTFYDRDWDSPRNIASIYEQYIAGLSEIGQLPFLLRYNAFPESHLDSLDNPAYATGFGAAEGRVLFLPSLNGTGGLDENPTPPGLSTVSPLNYSAAVQFSMFVPLAGFVIGGNVTGSRIGSGVQGAPSDLGLSSTLSQTVPEGSLETSASSTGEFFSGSFLIARRFGTNTSLGLEVEDLRGAGSLAAQILSTGPSSGSIERINSNSTISQRRITAGIERDLPHGQTLGFYYRYGLIEAADSDRSHLLNSTQEPLDSTQSSGHSSEFGFRLRGPLGRRFFYGAEASWVGLALSDDLTRAITVASHQRDRAERSSAGLGLGYFLNRRTVVSVDFAGGTSPASTSRTEIGRGDLLQIGLQNSRFLSANLGIQAKISPHLFLNASLLGIDQAYKLRQASYADSVGNTLLITDPFLPMTATGYRPPRVSSDFGAGWRFSNRLLLQYVFSTSYGADSGGHTFMLRYTFGLRGE